MNFTPTLITNIISLIFYTSHKRTDPFQCSPPGPLSTVYMCHSIVLTITILLIFTLLVKGQTLPNALHLILCLLFMYFTPYHYYYHYHYHLLLVSYGMLLLFQDTLPNAPQLVLCLVLVNSITIIIIFHSLTIINIFLHF